jgi:hypothetical protein
MDETTALRTMGDDKMRDFILNAACSIVFATLLATAVMAGIDKEAARQEKVVAYNCARYGDAMSAEYCVIHNPPIVKEARK